MWHISAPLDSRWCSEFPGPFRMINSTEPEELHVNTASTILIHVQEQLIITGHASTITSNTKIRMVQHEWLSQSKLESAQYRMASFWINYHMWRAVSHCDLPTAAPCCSNRPDTPDPTAQWPENWVDLPARSLQTPHGGTGRWTHGTTNSKYEV